MKTARIQDEKGRILTVYENDEITLASGVYSLLDPISFKCSITGSQSSKTTLILKRESQEDAKD